MHLYVYGPLDSGKTILVRPIRYYNKGKYELILPNYVRPLMRKSRFEKLEFKNEKVILTIRDPRIGWLLSNHKPASRLYRNVAPYSIVTIDEYCENYMKYLDVNQILSQYPYYYLTKYENLLNRFDETIKLIFDFIDLKFDDNVSQFKPKVFVNNFTPFDIEKIVRYISHVTQEEFDYISDRLKEYIQFFNYPKFLDLNSVTKKQEANE